jgi:hypothetical protein
MYLFTSIIDYSITGPVHSQIEKSNTIVSNYSDYSNRLNNLPKLELLAAYKAKLTDYLSWASQYLIVSKRLLDVLFEFNIPFSQYFQVEVFHRKKQYTYYLFFIYNQSYDNVDYKNMKFIGESNPPYSDYYREPYEQIGTQKKEIKVESPEQLISWQKLCPDYPNWKYENLKLNRANIQVDMIRTPTLLGNHYFVSEQLKNKIEEAGCTGMQFRTKDIFERLIL